MRGRALPKEDEKFRESIDWHPVDEFPLREEFAEELRKARNEPSGMPMAPEEFKKLCDEL